MKFGQSFHQRSIPAWSVHNIDYNDLKHEIKRRTTRGNGQAQAIPGSDNEAKALRIFEDELYTELHDQHARVDLFVRSKSDATSRQLTHLQRQTRTLERQAFSQCQTKISVRQLEKFSRLEDQTLKAGAEVQSLVQFVSANRLALQKLLKKYKKWTGSSSLGQRFRREILNHNSSLNSNFEPLFTRYVDTLAAVRASFDTGTNWHTELSLKTDRPASSKDHLARSKGTRPAQSASTSHLYDVNQRGSHIDLDTALATTPLGRNASRAVYWVHPENIVQLQILLLQSTRIRNWSISPHSTKTTNSLRSSPRGSVTGLANDCVNTGGHDAGLLVCDDLLQFAARQSGESIGDSEGLAGTTVEKAAASIRYSASSDLLLVLSSVVEAPEKSQKHPYRLAKFKRKAARSLFDTSSGVDSASTDTSEDIERSRQWFAKHLEVQPLVHLQYKRSHFTGIRNTETAGLWATLDTDVYMKESSKELLLNKDDDSLTFNGGEKDGWEQFPLAILEVRVEGNDASGLVTTLDANHLTTRIRGFSLEAHAVATICKPQGMPPPHWLSRLEEDLRKLPSPKAVFGRMPNKKTSPEATTGHTSISTPSTRNGPSSGAFSAVQGESSATSAPEDLAHPPLSAFKKKRKSPKRRRPPPKDLKGPPPPPNQRYWNEFDDGSEGEPDEPYTIFIDPNAPTTFPGAETVTKAFASLSKNTKASWEKVHSWMASHPHGSTTPEEQRPLLNGANSPPSPTIDDSSDSEIENPTTTAQRSYSTVNSHHQCRHRERSTRESHLFRTTLGCFAASFILVLIAAILTSTGRRKVATEVDIGAVIGVAASVVFAIIGVGCTVARHDRLWWVYRTAVGLGVVVVVLANAGVLIALGGT